MGVLGAFHKIKVISYRIGYTKIPLTLLRIASGGVLEVDQFTTMDDINFPDEGKAFVCIVETFIFGTEAAFCSVAAGWSR